MTVDGINLLDLLYTLQSAVLGDNGEPVCVLSEPLFADQEGEVEYGGVRYDLRPIISGETSDALDRYIQALEDGDVGGSTHQAGEVG